MADLCPVCAVKHRSITADQCRDRKMTERTLQDRVVYRAKKYGWRVAHAGRGQVGASGAFITPMSPGWPDLTCAKANYPILFIELKREQGVIEPEQREWLDLLNRTGNQAVVIRPSNLRGGYVDILFSRSPADAGSNEPIQQRES